MKNFLSLTTGLILSLATSQALALTLVCSKTKEFRRFEVIVEIRDAIAQGYAFGPEGAERVTYPVRLRTVAGKVDFDGSGSVADGVINLSLSQVGGRQIGAIKLSTQPRKPSFMDGSVHLETSELGLDFKGICEIK